MWTPTNCLRWFVRGTTGRELAWLCGDAPIDGACAGELPLLRHCCNAARAGDVLTCRSMMLICLPLSTRSRCRPAHAKPKVCLDLLLVLQGCYLVFQTHNLSEPCVWAQFTCKCWHVLTVHVLLPAQRPIDPRRRRRRRKIGPRRGDQPTLQPSWP